MVDWMENLTYKAQLLFFHVDAKPIAAVSRFLRLKRLTWKHNIIPEYIAYLKTNKIPVFQNFSSMWNGYRPGISRLSLKLNV